MALPLISGKAMTAPGVGAVVALTYRATVEQAPAELKRIRIDTYIGMAFSNIIALFIVITTAATLPRERVPSSFYSPFAPLAEASWVVSRRVGKRALRDG